jgi:serine/threonine-protein kinase RsbW
MRPRVLTNREIVMHPNRRYEPFHLAVASLGLEEKAQRVRGRSLAELRPTLEQIEGLMRVLGYPRKDIFAVILALAEAVTNAVRHGNRGDRGKQVQVSYLVTAAEVLVEVEDQGRGFDPGQVHDPLTGESLGRASGRGLFLMRAYLTWLSFNQEGNQVMLCKQRSSC